MNKQNSKKKPTKVKLNVLMKITTEKLLRRYFSKAVETHWQRKYAFWQSLNVLI